MEQGGSGSVAQRLVRFARRCFFLGGTARDGGDLGEVLGVRRRAPVGGAAVPAAHEVATGANCCEGAVRTFCSACLC